MSLLVCDTAPGLELFHAMRVFKLFGVEIQRFRAITTITTRNLAFHTVHNFNLMMHSRPWNIDLE